ncbi:uncharacterized protein LOC123446497 [Hordeum vulgare subsp. vulgare]|uniref:uncharacterized protein LOC123446497 n=1 Tax=Hordeum vulgare subsp. vulgare TaxID=112509 RepID=UPI00162F2709|nr:uncharacterized protein LOC123446497 [Hordeum vulgare subsp. vulgare]
MDFTTSIVPHLSLISSLLLAAATRHCQAKFSTSAYDPDVEAPGLCDMPVDPLWAHSVHCAAYFRGANSGDVLDPTTKTPDGEEGGPSWRRSLQHVCVATLTSFLFGYHTGVVNEPLESISADLGFAGPVVSICLGERSSDACLVALLLTELVFSAQCVTL